MLYFIYTVDGDWKGYFDTELSEEERAPEEKSLLDVIRREIDLAGRCLDGRFIHFIHTSSRARDFFITGPFLKLWREIIENGGDIGLHCHEDDPYKDYFYQDTPRMKGVISERAGAFRKAGLDVRCYRSGFMGFSSGIVRILEGNNVYFDFSCEPGRLLVHGDTLICDWRDAPLSHYRMSYNNHCQPGDSKVWEIPVGASEGRYLYFEKSAPRDIERTALDLKKRSVDNRSDIVVSVVAHTYDYGSLDEIKGIEENISILKKYGSFINIKGLEDIIS